MENQGPVILAADRDLQNEPNLRGPCAQAIPSFAPIIGAALREIRKADFIVNTQFWSQYCSPLAGSAMCKLLASVPITIAFTLCISGIAGAQESRQAPTQAQRDAVRASCRSDFMANCSGVQPGGKDALECLKRNEAKLSAPCKTAVNAIAQAASAPTPVVSPQANTPSSGVPQATPATAAAAPSPEDQLKMVRQACTMDDFMTHCSWIAPDSPELLLCLKGNLPTLSPSCQKTVQSLAESSPASSSPPASSSASSSSSSSPTGTAPVVESSPAPASIAPAVRRSEASRESKPAASAAASTAPASQKPSAEQLSAIRSSCRSDFMAHCSGVQPGGAAALQCLRKNTARVSAACQTALAAIGQSASKGTSASKGSTASATATPDVAPLGAMPQMRPREALVILRLCSVDQRTLCPGVSVGGGRVISCLAANASSLSPSCYAALSAAARR